MIKRLTDTDVKSRLDSMYIHGVDAGQWHGLNINLNFRKKSTMYIYGPDHSGKSRLFFFMALCMAERHGWKFLIYSPETGDAADIYAMLTKIYCGANKYIEGKFGITKEHKLQAERFLYKHFQIVDYSRGLTMDGIYEYANELNSNDWHVDCLCVDPFNAVTHDLDTTPRDVYLGEFLLDFDQNATKNDRLNVIIVHPTSQERKTVDINGEKVSFYDVADKREIMWGQEWSRKGKNLLSVWRPTNPKLVDEHGQPFREGYLVADVQKRKPDEVGEVGRYGIYFNWRTQRFYNDPLFHDCPLAGTSLEDNLPDKVAEVEINTLSLQSNKDFLDEVPF